MSVKLICCHIGFDGKGCEELPAFDYWIPAQGYVDSYFHACRDHIGHMMIEDAEFAVRPLFVNGDVDE